MKTIQSKLFALGKSDIVKGFIMAFIGVVGKAIQTGIDTNSFPQTKAEWEAILLMGAKVGGAYLIKNLLTNSNDKFLKKESDITSNTPIQLIQKDAIIESNS